MAKHTHTAHSTPHIITQISEITYSKGYTLQFTQHTKTKKSQHPTREPTLKKQENIISFPQSAAASAICCCCAVVMLLPCCVQPSTAASSHREETAARPVVRKLLLHVHRSAAENPTADLLPKTQPPICCSKAQAPTRPEFLP